MPSGLTIISNSLVILGILEQSGSPSASDAAAGLAELNSLWNSWGIDNGLIFSIQAVTKALASGVASYTIGTGGTFNTPLPTAIYRAFIAQTGNRTELKIIEAQQYYAHNDLTATAVTPDEVYLDFNVDPTTGLGRVYLWPVPTFTVITPSLELDTGVAFTAWSLGTNVNLPYGYQDAIQYALAFRLIPQYGGIVAPQVMQTVADLGAKAELRIRTMNARNRLMPPEMAALNPLGAPQAAPR